MSPRVVVVGSVNTDLVVGVDRFPEPGETVAARTFSTFGGGKGANQAIAAARIGAEVLMIGAVGSDAYSDERLADLVRDGVDVTAVERRSDVAGGIALIQVDATGQNMITIVAGANGTVTPDQVERALRAVLRTDDVVCCQLELPLASVTTALRVARDLGGQTVLNAAPAVAGAGALIPLVDVLAVNEVEAGQLLGVGRVAIADAAAAAQALVGLGPSAVVVTLGESGAVVRSGPIEVAVSAPRVPVVDSTGAGDAFVGALVACLASGMALEQAVRVGVQAGSLAVQRAGAQPSLPRRHELAPFFGAPSVRPRES